MSSTSGSTCEGRIVTMRQLISALVCALCLAALLDPGTAQAQIGHGFTPQDIENGGLLYQANCTGCHGPDGDGVAGVNLGSGRFRRASSDEDIARIIQAGVPGTAMPPSAFSEAQAMAIVAYLRSLAEAAPASAVPLGRPHPRQGHRRRQGPVPVVPQRGRRGQPGRAGVDRDRIDAARRGTAALAAGTRAPRFAPTTALPAPSRKTAPPLPAG